MIVQDFDGDGWPDVYVANDGQNNLLWLNQRDGTFRDVAAAWGVAVNGSGAPEASMGIACADFDADGASDLLLTHLNNETHTLYRRIDSTSFTDATAASGLRAQTQAATGFGVGAFDVELDGDVDLAVADGRVAIGTVAASAGPDVKTHRDYVEANQFFLNDGRGRFTDSPEVGGDFCSLYEVSRGLAAVDIDADGDVDLVLTNCGGKARLYRNEAHREGHWVALRLVDPRLRRDAFGATVRVQVGDRVRIGCCGSSTSYQTSVLAPLHFGIGRSTVVDRIEVIWPGGEKETFDGGPADRIIRIERGKGRK